MMLFEVAHPAGAFTAEDRDLLVRRIFDVALDDDHAPEETMRRARAMWHIGFRELHGWRTGDGPPAPDAAPPVIVTITVPEAWRAEVSRHMIGLVRAAVKRLDTTRGWARRDGDLWVNVLGVPDGSIGVDGKASTAEDVVVAMTEDYRAARAAGTAAPVPEGTLVDPMCGMLVRPGKGAITLDHDGATVGFCALGCRDAYVRMHDLEVV